MGGQACVFYGAAEFSRDIDLLVLVDSENLDRLRQALEDLGAKAIAVPPLEAVYLRSGHAVHFRCSRADVDGLRIDLMSSLRGLPKFEDLWQRRTSIEVIGEEVDLLSLEDLVSAKKTQRSKDWPMIQRLVEQHYFTNIESGNPEQIAFWLQELRTPQLLLDLTKFYPATAQRLVPSRPAIQAALNNDLLAISHALEQEEKTIKHQDRLYWEPLKRELEYLRHKKREKEQPKL